jgi:toxin YoeB
MITGYEIELTKRALNDAQKLKTVGLYEKAKKIRDTLKANPYDNISKKLIGDLQGKRSVRINLQHRLVYEILEDEKTIKVLSMWGHYE